MKTLTEWGQTVLAAQPFSRLLGTVLTELGEDRVELKLPITDVLKQHLGIVHGGVVSYLIDNALTYAAGAAFEGGAVTGEIKVNYLRPAIGDMLIARAWLVSAGRRQAVSRCDVFAADKVTEVLCAVGQGTIVSVPPATTFPFPQARGRSRQMLVPDVARPRARS